MIYKYHNHKLKLYILRNHQKEKGFSKKTASLPHCSRENINLYFAHAPGIGQVKYRSKGHIVL